MKAYLSSTYSDLKDYREKDKIMIEELDKKYEQLRKLRNTAKTEKEFYEIISKMDKINLQRKKFINSLINEKTEEYKPEDSEINEVIKKKRKDYFYHLDEHGKNNIYKSKFISIVEPNFDKTVLAKEVMDSNYQDQEYKFDLFISYSRIPDGILAKELERFLESFHKDLILKNTEQNLRQLSICIDNSDFSIPPAEDAHLHESSYRDVSSIMIRHLRQAKELLVLCSEQSAQSIWVIDEIQWFLENRGPGAIRIAFTQGEYPAKNIEKYLADNLMQHGFNKNLAYDFRGYDKRKSKNWQKVEDFKQEAVKLAAHLYGMTPGELYPSWLESELQRAREQSLSLSTNARLESLIGDPAHAVIAAYNAHQIYPNNKSERALKEAYKVAIYHHYNRRESSCISGAGPSYLAGRWKQSDVFLKNSPDGRYQLLVTERGKDGKPYGDVYLLSNETMRVVKLESQKCQVGRVEEVAFSKHSNHVFVTRYFYLLVYALDGQIIGSYDFSRHTKSPVHIVAGYLNKRFLLAGETKGGLWLIDPFHDSLEQIKVTQEVYREFHQDATIHINISQNGRAASLIFESGKAKLLILDENNKYRLLDILSDGVQYANFFADQQLRLITSCKNGIIKIWQLKGNTLQEKMNFETLDTAVDWVTISEDQMQLAAVAANNTIYIFDLETQACLKTIDYNDEIDWGNLRSVKIPEDEFARDKHKPFPPKDVRVNTMLETENGCWLGTTKGAYFRSKKEHRLMTPLDINIRVLKKFGDILYAGSKENGAYIIEKNRTVLISPSFLRIIDIKEVADKIWLITTLETGGLMWKYGPAYLVKGYFSMPFPNDNSEVSDVIEKNGEIQFIEKDFFDFSDINLAHTYCHLQHRRD